MRTLIFAECVHFSRKTFFFGPRSISFGPGNITILLEMHTLLGLGGGPPQTTPPLARFSKLRLDRNSSDSRGLELRDHATWQEAFQLCGSVPAFPFCPLLNSYFSHLFRPFSVAQWAQLGVNLGESASRGDIHLVSISILPPSLSATSCIHLVSISKLPPGAPQQLPAFIWFLWHVVSPQLPACFVIWVQCLGFTPHLSTTDFAHLVLISNCLFPPFASQLPASIWSFICRFPALASSPLLTFLLFQYPNFPCINNFLHASCLNIYIPPTPVPGPKKHVLVQKKEGAKVQKTSSSMRAPITMEFPPPPHPMEARSTKQAHGSKKQKPRSETINLAV